jgi:polar amino acid transport system substrate-binding protein
MKKVLSVLGSVLLCAASHAQPEPYTLEYSENPPFSMTQSGKPVGVAIDMIATLFDKAKIAYRLHATPLARGMAETKARERACVFPVQRAQSIEADYRWISPIFVTDSGLFMHPDATAPLIALADARPLKIGAMRGSGDAEYLKSLRYDVDEANTPEQSVEKLLNKRIDAWATDILSAQYFIEKNGGTKNPPINALTFRRSLGSLACNTKMPRADVERLQSTLDTMIRDGTLSKLSAAVR